MTPRTHRYRAGGRPDGLPTWTPHGPEPSPMQDNPRLRECRTTDGGCGAGIGQPCRARRPGQPELHGYHDARLEEKTDG